MTGNSVQRTQRGKRSLDKAGPDLDREAFGDDQLMACWALKNRLGLTYRQVAALLDADAELRALLGIKGRVPHYTTMQKHHARSQLPLVVDTIAERLKTSSLRKKEPEGNHEPLLGKPLSQKALPPLEKAFREFRGFLPGDNKFKTLARLLHSLVLDLRRSREQSFYSLREVSSFFQVSLRTAAKAYQQLAQEGLLVRQRGSQTIIPARTLHPRTALRAIIGVPVWLPGFCDFPDWRHFLIQFDEQLRRSNFVADFIFFGSQSFFGSKEVSDPALAGLVRTHQPDIVFWYRPASALKQTIEMIRDTGVRVIVAGAPQAVYPDQRYVLHHAMAVRQCAAQWKSQGVRTVTIPKFTDQIQGVPWVMSATHGALKDALTAEGIRIVEACGNDRPLPQYLRSLSEQTDAVCFDDDLWFHTLCRRAPEEMIALFRRTRCAIIDLMGLPLDRLKGVRIDVIHHDYTRFARHIAEELSSGTIFLRDKSTAFEAKWSPQAEALHFAHEF